jgi:ABC-type transport system involved in multi-copper enzyme maturation permease subunit
MSALISAELLRLRTVRSPAYGAAAILAFVALTTALNVHSAVQGDPGPAALPDALRSIALIGVLIAALLAATNIATHFQGGSVAMTYLRHPHRGHVGASQALTYAALGFVFAAAVAAVVLAVGALAVGSDQFQASYSALDVARMIGGAATGGALLGAIGVFIGTVLRNSTAASGALPAWYFVELSFAPASIQPYLPFGLVQWLMGGSADLSLPGAIGLLLAYAAVLSVIAVKWALPRDLT